MNTVPVVLGTWICKAGAIETYWEHSAYPDYRIVERYTADSKGGYIEFAVEYLATKRVIFTVESVTAAQEAVAMHYRHNALDRWHMTPKGGVAGYTSSEYPGYFIYRLPGRPDDIPEWTFKYFPDPYQSDGAVLSTGRWAYPGDVVRVVAGTHKWKSYKEMYARKPEPLPDTYGTY